MEYFRELKINKSEQDLHQQLTLANLGKFCTEIFNLEDPSKTESQIGGIWGEFTLSRSQIKGGVRFALLECPNALCWTITTGHPPNPESVFIHLTINRLEKEEEFIKEIIDLLDDLELNLREFLQ